MNNLFLTDHRQQHARSDKSAAADGVAINKNMLLKWLRMLSTFYKFVQVILGSVGEAICPSYTHARLDKRSPVVAEMADSWLQTNALEGQTHLIKVGVQ